MEHHIRHKNGIDTEADKLVKRLSERRLLKHLRSLDTFVPCLDTTLEARPNGAYAVRTRLDLLGGSLVTRAQGESVREAAEVAFDRLERRLKRYMERQRRDYLWKRPARRRRLRRLQQALARRPESERQLYADLLLTHVRSVTRLVRRELAFLRAARYLHLDYPAVDDVVDEVFARALIELPAQASIDVRAELNRICVDVLNEAISSAKAEMLPDWPASVEPAAAAAAEFDEDLEQWWEGNAEPGLNEITADSQHPTPLDVIERDELRQQILEAVRSLPTQWRRAVMLRHVDDQPLASVARALDSDEASVQRMLEHADTYLRARFDDAGIRLPATGAGADHVLLKAADDDDDDLIDELQRQIRALEIAETTPSEHEEAQRATQRHW